MEKKYLIKAFQNYHNLFDKVMSKNTMLELLTNVLNESEFSTNLDFEIFEGEVSNEDPEIEINNDFSIPHKVTTYLMEWEKEFESFFNILCFKFKGSDKIYFGVEKMTFVIHSYISDNKDVEEEYLNHVASLEEVTFEELDRHHQFYLEFYT